MQISKHICVLHIHYSTQAQGYSHHMCLSHCAVFPKYQYLKIQVIARVVQRKGGHSNSICKFILRKVYSHQLNVVSISHMTCNTIGKWPASMSHSPFVLNMFISASAMFPFLQNHKRDLPQDPSSYELPFYSMISG